MESYRLETGPDGVPRLKVPYRGPHLLSHPMYNKSTAFTREERRAFALEGLLPDAVSTLTPTVGRACQEFSHIFRRARGLWITPDDRGRIDRVLGDAPFEEVRLIVVTDNESILGLGDQGAGGMAIPVGKLALYTAAAGIHPSRTLPISLDVGTDNASLLADDLYLGWRHPRLRGEPYDTLVEEFVEGVKRRFPKAVLQWEDFRKGTAFALLERYRKALPSFNDDIQGTAAVAVAGVMASSRLTGIPWPRQRVVIFGAGAAGVGIARLMRDALKRTGVEGDDLRRAIALIDTHGLVTEEGAAGDYRRGLGWPVSLATSAGLGPGNPRDLRAVVRALKPTVLIGVSGAPGAFTEEVVREMARGVERPLIFPLSNPTSQSEATPADVVAWSEGRALVATGSPFAPVTYGGRTTRVGQGNNVFIFPGVGLGALLSEAREITEGMFAAAADRLAAEVRDEDLAAGSLFPPIADLRRITARIAEAVVREARGEGVGRDLSDAEIPRVVAAAMWEPAYPRLEPD